MIKTIIVLFVVLFLAVPVCAQQEHKLVVEPEPRVFAKVQEYDLLIEPRLFGEIRPTEEGSNVMVCGMRFSIVNPNPYVVENIIISEITIESPSRGKITRKDLGGPAAWLHIQQIPIRPYTSYDYLDAVLVFGRNTLDKYYSGKEALTVRFKVNYTVLNKTYIKEFKWEYSNKEWKPLP